MRNPIAESGIDVRRIFGVLLIAAIVLSLCSATRADDAAKTWPQLLGPNRNGISTETGLIDRFGPDGPKIVWRVPGGVGKSGIALDGKRAITMVEQDGKQTVLALDAASGKTLWQTPVAPGYRNSMGAGPRATPTIASGSVYAFTGEGILVALDQVTGKIRWRHNVVREAGGKPAEYGMACSPLVVGKLVIVTAGVKGASIVAYDTAKGTLVWKQGDDPAGYSSPALRTVGGREQVVVFTGGAATGLVPKTGKPLWRYAFKTDYNCNIATPIAVGKSRLFISSGENHGSVMLYLKPSGEGLEATEAWKSLGRKSVMRNEWQTSVLIDGYLYGMDNQGAAGPITHLNCVHAETGKLVWRQIRFGKGNLIAADGKLYISTFKGDLVIVRASPKKFEELARAKVIIGTRQAPALLGGKIYLRDGKEIVCVDVRK